MPKPLLSYEPPPLRTAPKAPFVTHGEEVNRQRRSLDHSMAREEDPRQASIWDGERSPRSQEEYDAALENQEQLRYLHGGLPDSSSQNAVRNPATVAKFR